MRVQLWPDAPAQVQATAGALIETAQAAGVRLRIGEGERLRYPNPQGTLVSGYFVGRPRPELGIAIGGDWTEAFPILLHEFAHLDQWREQAPVWCAIFRDGMEAADWIDRWLAGETFPAADLAWAFRAARAVEHDCEQRVLARLSSLPVDPRVYAQKANAYLFSYHQAERTRRWPEHPRPCETPAIWGLAPDQLVPPERQPPALAAAFAAIYTDQA